MFTGKGKSTNSTNSANSGNSRLAEIGLINTNIHSRLGEMIKRDPEVGIIAATWSKSNL